MHRVLVTGGAGFIGSHVADSLIDRGHEVTVLDDLTGGFEDNLPSGARFVRGSVTDDGMVDRLFAEQRFDYVYHLAAYAAEGLSHFIKRFNYTNNVIGSVNLINASINSGVKGFVFTSSIAVYGASPVVPMTEDTPLAPADPYGIAKYAVERELASSREMFGLEYMIFRPHNVYGPGQNTADRYRNVVGIFMNQILQDRPMTIFGDGTQTRAFSYIEDVAPVMAAAIDQPLAWNEVFNVGSDRPYTLNDLAERVAAAMQVPARLEHLPARHEVQHAHASHEKLRRVVGQHETTSLDEGLRAMAAWVRKKGARASSVFENIEVRKNLPGIWAGSGTTG
jgi:UDP-glucose 4-epimerase